MFNDVKHKNSLKLIIITTINHLAARVAGTLAAERGIFHNKVANSKDYKSNHKRNNEYS